MPKGSAELTNARREEIIAACRRLYETMSFKEITLKEIGQQTSFTRTSIYNYFETKEEIFLALFAQEYELFTESRRTSSASAGRTRACRRTRWPPRCLLRWSAAP